MPKMVSTPSNPVTGDASAIVITGKVHGGQNPISGAQVYLYAVNDTGYAGPGIAKSSTNAAVSMLNSSTGNPADGNGNYYVLSGSDGSFTITGDYSCTAPATVPPSPAVYLLAVGGNPGSGNNPVSVLAAGLGPCGSLTSTTTVIVNEVSTVAAAYASAGFATDPYHVSSSNSTLAITGVEDSLAAIVNLETENTGVAVATNGYGTAPQATVNTLANILAACVNSTGAVTGPTNPTPCYTLFNNAENGSTPATDTGTAILNIAHNPGANVANLFALQGGSPPFIPDLGTAPNDFTLAFVYSDSCLDGPLGIALDSKDAIWVASNGGSNICEFTPLGNYHPVTGNGISGPYGIAIDGNGYAWVASETNALSSFTSGRAAVATTSTGGLDDPQNLAIDASNDIWVQSFGNALTEYTNSSGTPSTVTGDPFGTTVLNGPRDVAVDDVGNIWVVNSAGTPEIIRFTGSSPSTTSTFTGEGLDVPVYLAFDPSGNLWVTNDESKTFASEAALSEFNSTGGGVGYYDGSGLNDPIGIAIDSNGNVWAADEEGNCISESNSSGTAISPSTGYGGSGVLNDPFHLAIDLSGNLWVTNPGTGSGNTVTEFIGIASPVVTPMVANFQGAYAANDSAVNRP
jgi:hypothetical protein